MSDKKQIVRKLIILFVLMLVLDQGIGTILQHLFFAKKNGFDYRANYVINSTHADVLVFGSSKAAQHYNTRIMRDSLKLSVYNAGRDLSYIFYHYGLLECVLKRYSPKLIILDTRTNELQKFENGEDYDRINILLPFYNSHPEIREVVLRRSKFERYKLLSKIYPYNSLILPELIELLPIARYKTDDSDDGYIGKVGQWKGPKPPYDSADDIDSIPAMYYKRFIMACKERNIKVVVAFSPLYQNIDLKKNRNIAFVYQFCRQNNVPVLDYLSDKDFNDVHYFFDPIHLNRTGADLFTQKIVKDVRALLKDK